MSSSSLLSCSMVARIVLFLSRRRSRVASIASSATPTPSCTASMMTASLKLAKVSMWLGCGWVEGLRRSIVRLPLDPCQLFKEPADKQVLPSRELVHRLGDGDVHELSNGVSSPTQVELSVLVLSHVFSLWPVSVVQVIHCDTMVRAAETHFFDNNLIFPTLGNAHAVKQ